MGACKTCGGSGKISIDFDIYENGRKRKQIGEVICPDCGGDGTNGRKDEGDGDNGNDRNGGYTFQF